MYLVNTNVVSAGSPLTRVSSELASWIDAQSSRLFLSVMTIVELESGIAKARREGATNKAVRLGAWIETVLHVYGSRILNFNTDIAGKTGALMVRARGLGHAPGLADIIIAATAAHHGLTVLTRNMQHFAPLGVAAVDPFGDLP